jgi:hypothetical protein
MTPLTDIPQIIRSLTQRTRMVSLSDAAFHMQQNGSECERVLDEYVARGVLRKTQTKRGQTYYWLSDASVVRPEAES